MCRRDLFKSAETVSEAALTRIAADLLLFQRRLVAGMLRLVTRSLRADLFRFYVATIHKRDEGMVASFICCHRLCISNPAIECNGLQILGKSVRRTHQRAEIRCINAKDGDGR